MERRNRNRNCITQRKTRTKAYHVIAACGGKEEKHKIVVQLQEEVSG
jgi:hypothetical protein